MCKDKNFVIWSDNPYNTEDIEEYKNRMREDMPGELDNLTDDEIYRRMEEENNDCLYDERVNLDVNVGAPIIIAADLGLWNGHRKGYSIIQSGNLKDCLRSHIRGGSSYNTFYVTPDGEFCQDETHHDGTNHYYYRTFRDDLTEEEKEDFLESFDFGVVSEEEFIKKTKSLGNVIAAVYGWKLEKTKPEKGE